MANLLLFIEKNFEIVFLIQVLVDLLLLVIAIKKDSKKAWISLFSFEGLFIILAEIMYIYTFNKDYDGWEEFNIKLSIVLDAAINIIFLSVSYCIKIIRFEKNNKKQNKKNKNPLILIAGITCVLVGLYYLSNGIYQNRGYKGTIDGTVTEVLGGSNGHFAYIGFNVNGEELEDAYINMDLTLKEGDKINIPYYYYDSKYHIHDYYEYRQYYLPLFITGIILITYRFRKKDMK